MHTHLKTPEQEYTYTWSTSFLFFTYTQFPILNFGLGVALLGIFFVLAITSTETQSPKFLQYEHAG